MGKYGAGLALAILVACTGLPRASHAQAMGEVRVAFAKAGLIAGAGAGRGVLTYRGRDYPFWGSRLEPRRHDRRLRDATDRHRHGAA